MNEHQVQLWLQRIDFDQQHQPEKQLNQLRENNLSIHDELNRNQTFTIFIHQKKTKHVQYLEHVHLNQML
jgi:hypothetical protein